jgi:hypothetical protein
MFAAVFRNGALTCRSASGQRGSGFSCQTVKGIRRLRITSTSPRRGPMTSTRCSFTCLFPDARLLRLEEYNQSGYGDSRLLQCHSVIACWRCLAVLFFRG